MQARGKRGVPAAPYRSSRHTNKVVPLPSNDVKLAPPIRWGASHGSDWNRT